MKKTSKFAALGLTAGLAVGGATGLVLAVPAVSGAQSNDTTVTEGTTDGTTADTARPDRSARLAETLAPLVADGTLTQEQADKVVATLEAARPEGGPGMGHGGRGKGLDAAATALGITAEELRTELQSGQTIAQVAEAKGVDPQAVIDAMVAEARTRLDEKAAAGDLTQEEADAKLAEQAERITSAVNDGMPARGERGGRSGTDEAPSDDATADTTVPG